MKFLGVSNYFLSLWIIKYIGDSPWEGKINIPCSSCLRNDQHSESSSDVPVVPPLQRKTDHVMVGFFRNYFLGLGVHAILCAAPPTQPSVTSWSYRHIFLNKYSKYSNLTNSKQPSPTPTLTVFNWTPDWSTGFLQCLVQRLMRVLYLMSPPSNRTWSRRKYSERQYTWSHRSDSMHSNFGLRKIEVV